MKKIIVLLLLSSGLFAAEMKAQTAFSQTASNPTGAISGTAVDTMTVQLNGYQSVVGIQYLLNRTGGTSNGVIVALQGSVDGSNYVTFQSDTLTNAATSTGIVRLAEPVYIKYRILVTGVSTLVGTASAKITGRKP